MKALKVLKENLKATGELYELGYKQEKDYKKILEAIKELEELQKNIDYSIEEIEYALAKPKYADVYLNNALRFLKER